ncbi:MAG: NAD-dependent epimerase/dehydratase family protein [Hyphomicrobiaceae bacterium]
MSTTKANPVTTPSLRILVTGATGALGQRVVARLVAEGHAVRLVTRRPFRADAVLGRHATCIEWHPLSEPLPEAALADLDAIVHLAGEPLAGPADTERALRLRSSRLKLAERLAIAARNQTLRIVVASVVMPPLTTAAGEVMTDLTPRSEPATAFERGVLDIEAACNALASGGASLAMVRLGLLIDAGPVLEALVRLARRGGIPNFAGALIPAIDPEDAAALIAGLVGHRGLTGPLIGVAPEPLAGEILQAALVPFNPWPVALPVSQRRVERRIGPLARLLFNRTRVVPQRLLDAGAGFQNADLAASLARALAVVTASRGSPRDPVARWLDRRRADPIKSSSDT